MKIPSRYPSWLLALLLTGWMVASDVFAQNFSLLVVNSYHQEYLWTRNQHRGFLEEFAAQLPSETILKVSTEHLDTKRVAFTSGYQELFADYLAGKYSSYSPDLIYVTDDNALHFALEHLRKQFDDVPIVFSGINDLQRQQVVSPLLNGSFERLPIPQMLDMLRKLEPDLKQIQLVGDGSITYKVMRATMTKQTRELLPELQLLYADSQSFEATMATLEQQESGVVLLVTIGGFRDQQGRRVPISQVIAGILAAGDFRIFTVEDTYLIPGVSGGWVNSGRAQGAAAAKVARQMFTENPDFLKGINVFPAAPVFDYPTLQSHGYNLNLLPANSKLLREPQSFYHRNLKLVWGTASLVFLQTLIIGYLILNVRWRKRAESANRQSEQQFREVVEDAPDSIFVSDHDGQIIIANKFACDMLGTDRTEVVKRRVWQYQAGGSQYLYQKFWSCLPSQSIYNAEMEFLRSDGGKLPVHVRIRWLDWGGTKLLLGFVRDIAARKKAEATLKQNEERLEFLANHDPLTGLANRLLFKDRLQHAIALNQRTESKVALLFLDLDRFKTINDTLGHETGDRLLQAVAKRLQTTTRAMDTVARLGGDEFVIIVESVNRHAQVATIARNVLQALKEPILLDPKELRITTSLGISVFPDHGNTIEALLQAADVAMYRAKEQGRNTFVFYNPVMSENATELLSLEHDLHQAEKLGQLQLYYQPQVNLNSGELIGIEALLRWNHPTLGLVPPGDFIPLAEETGLILSIGRWVLNEACQQLARWKGAGFPMVPVAVNISPRQFREKHLAEIVKTALKDAELEPRWLELEITEGVLMEHTESARNTLEKLNRLGVRLVIDDFGSGYSSLSYLKRFPIHGLKIDREFIDDLGKDRHDAAIVATIVALAQGLDLTVLAEGIEQIQQQQELLNHGCILGQGYYFGRPQPADDILTTWKREYLPS